MNQLFRANTALLLAAAVSTMSVVAGCKSVAPAPAPGPDTSQVTPTAPPPPAASPASAPMSVDDLVAPIALYPDKLLAQILTASTNAQEVLDGGNWLLQNQNLKGDALAAAAKQVGLSPSMQYLTAFPQVVDNLCQQIEWTTQLGQAFQANPKDVMDAIQRKRVQAQQLGNLKSSPQMTVDTKKAENGQSYVEIQPASPQVVYVPQYNPVTIYNTPAPPATTTVVTTQSSGVSTGAAVAIGLLSFGVGMAIGASFNNNNYYPYPAWGYGHVYYGGRPYYPPPYRPVYPGYRPAYGYHPPPNYHWNNYNQSINKHYNNSNYYGRYNNNSVRNTNVNVNVNSNNRPGLGGNPNLAGNNTRPANQPNWKGQSTYQGARTNTNNAKPGDSTANRKPANRPGGNNSSNTALANRPGAGNAGSMRPPGTANTTAMARPATTPANLNRGGDRGYGNGSARTTSGSPPATRPTPQAQNHNNGGAFSSSGSARSERTASNRGQASFGGGAKGHKRQ
jgi:Protein of unknown function (DUF3300)